MLRLTGGQAIVKSLIAQGVDTIFGLPGVQNDYIYNALYDERDTIRLIHTRHEQGAAYMALGYALSRDKAGVYNVVPGPGVLNTTAALSTAYATNAKVLCLTGQIPTPYIGRDIGMLHEIPDQLGVIRSLTKWAERITSPGQAPGLVAEAFRQLDSGRPRPVGLECAMDVLASTSLIDHIPGPQPTFHPPVDTDMIENAAKLLGQAKNPMIFVGRGAMGVSEEVKQLAELLQAPVIGYRTGRGVLSSRHYLSHPIPAAHKLWPKVDVALAIGSRLQLPQTHWGVDSDLTIIRIDVDPEALSRIARPHIGIVARNEEALPELVRHVEKHNRTRASRETEMLELKAWTEDQFSFLAPQNSFLKVIREELPDDGLFVDELTQIGYVSRQVLPVYKPYTFISTGYQGTLGWGFATALGVKVAHPDTPVISVAGDGGFMFNVQELATAVQHQIGLVTLLFNDNAFGNVKRMQQDLYDNRIIASDLHNPDFVKMGESFGAQAIRAHNPEEMRQAILKGFAEKGPTLIEIPVGDMPDPEKFKSLPRVRG